MTDKEIFLQAIELSGVKPHVNHTSEAAGMRHGFMVGALMKRDQITLSDAKIEANKLDKEFFQVWLDGKLNTPMYVRMGGKGGTALRFMPEDDGNEPFTSDHRRKRGCYYRDAGCWSVDYKFKDGKLVADCEHMPWMHEQPMTKISEKVWRKDNKGFL